MHRFEEQWPELVARCSEYRDAADSRVERWVWLRGPADWGRPQPYYRERTGTAHSKVAVIDPPASAQGVELFGLDARGEVVVARSFDAFGNVTEELFLRSGEGVWSVRYESFSDQVRPVALAEEDRRDGVLGAYRAFRGEDGWEHERYSRDDAGRVIQIERTLHDRLTGGEQREQFQVRYDESGLLAEIVDDDGRRIYQAKPAKLGPLLRRAEEALAEEIAEMLGALDLRQRDAILIGYDYASPLEPTLAVSPGLAASTSREPVDVWNPWEQERRAQLSAGLPSLRLLGDDAGPLLAAATDDELLRGLMVKVANRTQKNDRVRELGATVLPVDADMEHLERNARELLPRPQFRLFAAMFEDSST